MKTFIEILRENNEKIVYRGIDGDYDPDQNYPPIWTTPSLKQAKKWGNTILEYKINPNNFIELNEEDSNYHIPTFGNEWREKDFLQFEDWDGYTCEDIDPYGESLGKEFVILKQMEPINIKAL